MNADDINRSISSGDAIPDGLPPVAKVLWLARAGQWDAAHDLCQDLPDPAGAWIHAWLHRQEGDYGNACYWYERAGKRASPRHTPLDQEWMDIAKALLG